MLLNFFPSRAIAWYLGKTFLLRCLAMLAMLVLVLQMLDLLSEAGHVWPIPAMATASCGAMSRCACRRSSRASCPSRCCSAR